METRIATHVGGIGDDGYLVLERLLDHRALHAAVTEAERLIAEAARRAANGPDMSYEPGPADADGRRVPRAIRSVASKSDVFPRLSERLRLSARAADLLDGGPIEPLDSVLWCKPSGGGAQHWHQDPAFATNFYDTYRGALVFWIALDPATRESGCLFFLPGYHRKGLLPHDEVRVSDERTGLEMRLPREDVERARPVELAPGSAVVFDVLTPHASPPNRSARPRRAITFGFASRRAATPMEGVPC